jgi:peptide/nickel transport system substrate-binding protein
MDRVLGQTLGRRGLVAGAAGAALSGLWLRPGAGRAQEGGSDRLAELAIDLASEPPTLDPAKVYDADAWSVVHSVYDALVQYGPDGRLEPLLAESLAQTDPLTWEIRLRQGVAFHNGEPFDARSVAFSVAHIKDPETGSQVASTFGVIEAVEEVDPFTVRLKLASPAPWLPAQMAAWLAMLPPAYAADPANDFANNPVGTGPYRFERWQRGAEIRLAANEDYVAGSPKGTALADAVRFRVTPEATTRVADLLSGTVGIVRGVPVDQAPAVEEAARLVVQPLSGTAFVRIPTDVTPFDDPRVRQALNLAVDVDAIVAALLDGHGARLPNFFVEGGLGWDADLKPYPYDPERARTLLAEAGLAKGFRTRLAHTVGEREDLVAAIAGQLAEVGIDAVLEPTETATFNATWTDPEAAPLRFVTWRPMFDPYTLLSLLVSAEGFLSRYDNPNAQKLIEAAAAETDDKVRADLYRQLGRTLRDEPAAIYLWRLTSFYGTAPDLAAWTPRPDDYIIPTAAG